MLCVICISRGGSASVSFSEVEERSVDLRNVSTVPSQSEPTRYVGPNITGTAQGDEFPTTELVQLDGAFYKIGTFGDTETGGGRGSASIGFDASLVSNVYGGSSTVQPPSVALLACIKI